MICGFQDPLRHKCPGNLYIKKDMDGCMNEWMDGYMDEQEHGCSV